MLLNIQNHNSRDTFKGKIMIKSSIIKIKYLIPKIVLTILINLGLKCNFPRTRNCRNMFDYGYLNLSFSK